MTNQEAIKILKNTAFLAYQPEPIEVIEEAVNKAISALQAQEVKTQLSREDTTPKVQQTCNQLATDAISRQAAIDIVTGYSEQLNGYIGTPNDTDVYAYARGLILGIERNLNALQSAQPEIIICRDCKHSMNNENNEPWICAHPNNNAWRITPDHYCGYAERRTDE